MRTLFIILILFCFVTINGQSKTDTVSDVDKPAIQLVDMDYIHVSLINLIANPERYHKKRIQVRGFLNLEFEGDAIYLHKEDYVRGLTENGFWVEFSDKLLKKKQVKDFSNKYVIIIGTFNMKRNGHGDLFAGTFENIVRLDKWDFSRDEQK